jgi:serine/threonine protein kinase
MKYQIINEIGTGRFGTIYKGLNLRTNTYVAIKMEPLNNETKLLKNETKIYQYLIGGKGIPNVLWFGNDETNTYMVMNLLGKSLTSIVENKVILSLYDISNYIIQIIERLKYIHNKGLIHRDIKPDNFLFGVEENDKTIYLIDFGFCKKYVKNGFKINNSFVGTPNYISINLHNGIEASRRDDLESVFYIFYYLFNGYLEWNDMNLTDIREMKMIILNDNTIPREFKELYMYCRNLEFDETPDYDYLIKLLKK